MDGLDVILAELEAMEDEDREEALQRILDWAEENEVPL